MSLQELILMSELHPSRLTSLVQVRVTPEEKELWKEKALLNGLNLSEFIRLQVERSIDEDLEKKYEYIENSLQRVRNLIDEFRDLFPSERSGFSFE